MASLKKDIANCKHPNSRKALALAKKTRKEKHRQQAKMGQYIKQNVVGEKILWFQDNLPEIEANVYEVDQVHDLIERYIQRFDEELEQINLKNSIGGKRNRQHGSREDIINMTKEREIEEYKTCGIEIPDLTNSAQLQMLKSWNGELRFIQNFKLKRFKMRK